MPLQLKITSTNKDLLGDEYICHFDKKGGSIGRAESSDWTLPDPRRFISSRHATVDYKSGSYYLADLSSNGVYVNDDDDPIGNDKPRRLFDGDTLRMGDFEIAVTVDEGEDFKLPPPEPMSVVPDHLEQLVPEEVQRSSLLLLDEEEITGDDEFQATLFGTPPKAKKKSGKKAGNKPNPFQQGSGSSSVAADRMVDAFFSELGIKRSEIDPSTDPLELMANAGKVLHAFIDGVAGLLASRAKLKSLFRLDQTTVMPRQNNPLKMCDNTHDMIMQLLVGANTEFLRPVDSVNETCRDLRFHHDALLEAMTSAFLEFSERFDPDELQENFDRTLKRKPLLQALNRVKYWQLYCDLYPIMTQRGTGVFPHHFGEEFVQAYEQQIAEYMRLAQKKDKPQPPVAKIAARQPADADAEPQDQSAEAQATVDF